MVANGVRQMSTCICTYAHSYVHINCMLILNDAGKYRNTYINSDRDYEYHKHTDHTYTTHIIGIIPAPISLTGPNVTTS